MTNKPDEYTTDVSEEKFSSFFAVFSEVIHHAGHEIGNPLTSIISLASLLERSFLDIVQGNSSLLPPEKLQHYSRSIIDEAWKISLISERLVLLFSERELSPQPCDLEHLMERALKKLSARCRIDTSSVKISCPELEINSDEDQISAVFFELILNAIEEVVSENNSSSMVEILAEKNNQGVKVVIKNPLLSKLPENINLLFNPGCSYRGGTKHLGIGLTVAKRICSRNAVDLTLQNEEGFFLATLFFPVSQK